MQTGGPGLFNRLRLLLLDYGFFIISIFFFDSTLFFVGLRSLIFLVVNVILISGVGCEYKSVNNKMYAHYNPDDFRVHDQQDRNSV